MKLILTDKTEMEITQFTVPRGNVLMVVAQLPDADAVLDAWKQLTPEQLEEFSIEDDNDVTLASYTNGAVTDADSHVNSDEESISAHFYIRAEPVPLAEKAAAYDILTGEVE